MVLVKLLQRTAHHCLVAQLPPQLAALMARAPLQQVLALFNNALQHHLFCAQMVHVCRPFNTVRTTAQLVRAREEPLAALKLLLAV